MFEKCYAMKSFCINGKLIGFLFKFPDVILMPEVYLLAFTK